MRNYPIDFKNLPQNYAKKMKLPNEWIIFAANFLYWKAFYFCDAHHLIEKSPMIVYFYK